jgi:hypothetical protein
MNKKAFALIQHKLIPTTLIAGNIALVHLIYLLEKGGSTYSLVLTAGSVIVLTTAILRPHKYLLLMGIFFYAAVLLLTFL